jgi:hypothetical protein
MRRQSLFPLDRRAELRLVHLHEQRFLAVEVMMDELFARSRATRNLRDSRTIESALREFPRCGNENALACSLTIADACLQLCVIAKGLAPKLTPQIFV